MRDIQINGVGFNVDAVLKMTKEEFLEWNFFTECWTHLKADKKREAIEEAWNVINEYGNLNGNIKQPELPIEQPTRNSRAERNRNKGKLSKPTSGTDGNGTEQRPDADNA